MEGGPGQGRLLQNVYDKVPAPQGTTRVPSTSVRSGRRTGSVIINRIVTEDVLDGEALLLRTLPHREVSVPLQVEALGLGTDHERCTDSRQRRTSVISTFRCRCPRPLPRGTALRNTRVADGTKVPVQKLSGLTSDQCLNRTRNSILGPRCLHPLSHELSINLVPKALSD